MNFEKAAYLRIDSRISLDSVHSEGLFNQSFDSDDLEAFDIQDPDFGNFAEADESGYYSSDQLQEAIDR